MEEEKRSIKTPMPENVTLERHPAGLRLSYRWFSGKSTFLAAFYCVGLYAILFNWYKKTLSQVDFSWNIEALLANEKLILLLLLFVGLVAAGIGTYYTIARFLNRTTINVTTREISVRHGPLPWFRNRTIQVSEVRQLYREEAVSRGKNSTSTRYQLSVALKNNRKIKLLTGLESSDVPLFLEQEIEEWLGIKDERVTGEMQK